MSVDAGDNDPVRFWAHVIAGVTNVSAGFGAAASRVLTAPGAAGLDAALPMLVNELAALPAPLTLAFDDYHLISNQEVLHSVAFLVEHLPPGVRLALAARADPELPLARLRARGELLEIRADDLRFTEDETAALLNGTMSLPWRRRTSAHCSTVRRGGRPGCTWPACRCAAGPTRPRT